MSLIYLDTGPLKGLLDAHDQEHERATAIMRRAEEAHESLMCPYPALLELHRLLIYRKPQRSDAIRRAHAVIRHVLGYYPTVIPDDDDIQVALGTLERFQDQKITFTDATIASMAVRSKAKVMTFDEHHFGLMSADIYR